MMLPRRKTTLTTRILSFLMAFFMVAGLFGCNKDGDWASSYVYLWDDAVKTVCEDMAAGTGYVGDDVAEAVRESCYTDFGRLIIAGDTFTFYDMDQTTELCTCQYDDRGTSPMKHILPWHRFELKKDQPVACNPYKYFLVTDPGSYPTGDVLIQVRYGVNGFDELEGEKYTNWWPVLTHFATTTPQSVAAYLSKISDFYMSMLPDEADWPEGAKPADRFYYGIENRVQQAMYDANGNLHVIFMPAVYDTDVSKKLTDAAAPDLEDPAGSADKHTVDPRLLGYKVSHAWRDAVTGAWNVEDVIPTPGAGERGASMAIDANGTIHVVYGYRAATIAKTSLGYVYKAGGAWSDPVWIDGELSDPSIPNRRGDSGDRPKILVASNGNLMVAYAAWKHAIRLATFDVATSQWTLEDVETTDPTYPTPEDKVILGHWSIEFRLDSADRPHIAYRCSDLQLTGGICADGYPCARIIGMHVRYATKPAADWVVENVGAAAGWTDKFLLTLGFTLANDEPFVITGYQDVLTGNDMRVKCAKKIGGVWQTDLVYNIRDSYYGLFQIGAETDASQRVHISFCAEYVGGDRPRHSLMYGMYDGRGWEVKTAVDAAQYKKHVVPTSAGSFYMGNSQDVAVDAAGKPSIVFQGRYEQGGIAIGGLWTWSK